MSNIGIIFIATGVYNTFWQGFYESINANFCIESKKNFYVFTDDEALVNSCFPDNVFVNRIEDQGWVMNVMRRSEFFLSIEDKLKNNDFVFNVNSNYRAINVIHDYEILPDASNGWLSGLCFDFYCGANPDTFQYERNAESGAYIPFGLGKYYFQGGFYGGRTKEFFEMSRSILSLTNKDISRKIVPIFHDESYVNNYFLSRNPRVIGTKYAVAEQWGYSCEIKGQLLDKDKWFDKHDIDNLKAVFTDYTLSFLVDEDMKSTTIGVVNLMGGLGNQMFQYALMLSLQKKFPKRRFYINKYTLPMLECHQGYQLDIVLSVDEDMLIPLPLLSQIDKANYQYKRYINETLFAAHKDIEDSTHPIWIISGYWQSEKYFCDSIKDKLKFSISNLNQNSLQLLQNINNCENSVAVHVRRGDYIQNLRTYNLMGAICTKNYYENALKNFGDSYNIFIFSDDIEWCKEHLYRPNAIYVSHNRSKDSWQDMVLMSACQHQIISNSSFSWWAAWLNTNAYKKIIAPNKWFNEILDKDLIPDTWTRISDEFSSDRYDDLTVIIPLRIDSKERKRNIKIVLDMLGRLNGIKIIVLEADIVSRISFTDNVKNIFVKDTSLKFRSSKYINVMSKLVDTEYLAIWDTDIIVPISQLNKALDILRNKEADIIYPHDGRCCNLSEDTTNNYGEMLTTREPKSVLQDFAHKFMHCNYGGAVLMNRSAYEDTNCENEDFSVNRIGNIERHKRWELLDYRINHINGYMYHLYHPITCEFDDNANSKDTQLLLKIWRL